jgi:hypothetical protein
VDDLRTSFVCEDKSFYIAFMEYPATGDRSVSFRLTTAGLGGHTEWSVRLRRVRIDDSDEYFLCAEY